MSESPFDEMVALSSIAHAVSAGMVFQEILDLTTQQLAAVLHAETVLLFLPKGDHGLGLRSVGGKALECTDGAGETGPLTLDEEAVQGEVKAVVYDDVFTALQPWAPRCLLYAPLPLRGQPTPGAIVAINKCGGATFDERDVSSLRFLSIWVALAVDNVRLEADLQRMAEEKTDFVSLVAHELKGPMTSISGYAKLLGLGTLGEMSDAQKQFLDTISRNVYRMDRLVSVLLDLSRLEAGRIKLDRQIVSLRSVIEEAVQRSIERMRSKSINFDWSPPPELPLVRADPVRMVQIVDDLLSNASLYTPDEGAISIHVRYPASDFLVSAKESGCYVEVEIRDSGIGIAEEDQSKLFKQFFRGDHPLVQEAGGTGFSLLVTRRLVDLHGGRIGVSSQLGQGSRFQVVVPALSADAPSDRS